MRWKNKMIRTYASYFASYLIYNLKNFDNVSRIILFGSGARGDENKESDVDIFIETNKKTKIFENEIEKITENFYKSREALIFKSKGINNKINVIVGELKEWKELKKSIESTGIVLYGKFQTSINKEGRKYSIFYWDNIKKNRGAFLNKIYGFKVSEKEYSGLIERFNGRKLGKSCIMIPIEHRDEIIKLFKHYGVNAKVIDVYGD